MIKIQQKLRYIELREATRYARKKFKNTSIFPRLEQTLMKNIPRYKKLPFQTKEKLKEFTLFYKKQLAIMNRLSNKDPEIFKETYLALTALYKNAKTQSDRFPSYIRLKRTLKTYEKKFEKLNSHS